MPEEERCCLVRAILSTPGGFPKAVGTLDTCYSSVQASYSGSNHSHSPIGMRCSSTGGNSRGALAPRGRSHQFPAAVRWCPVSLAPAARHLQRQRLCFAKCWMLRSRRKRLGDSGSLRNIIALSDGFSSMFGIRGSIWGSMWVSLSASCCLIFHHPSLRSSYPSLIPPARVSKEKIFSTCGTKDTSFAAALFVFTPGRKSYASPLTETSLEWCSSVRDAPTDLSFVGAGVPCGQLRSCDRSWLAAAEFLVLQPYLMRFMVVVYRMLKRPVRHRSSMSQSCGPVSLHLQSGRPDVSPCR